jgi:hypothetical protein
VKHAGLTLTIGREYANLLVHAAHKVGMDQRVPVWHQHLEGIYIALPGDQAFRHFPDLMSNLTAPSSRIFSSNCWHSSELRILERCIKEKTLSGFSASA